VTPDIYRDCHLCAAPGPQLRFVKDGFSIVECRRCGLVYVGDHLAGIDFQSLYGESYYRGGNAQVFADYLGEERARRAVARRKLWSLRRLTANGRLLDVGCAAGFFLAEARRYFDVQGVELSEYSSRFAREHLGLPVFTGSLAAAKLAEASFDLITLWDVIEHVPDPLNVLRECRRLLRPSGHVVLTTGDIGSGYAVRTGSNWHLLAPPWHLYYFSRRTMTSMADRAGLSIAGMSAKGVSGDGWLARSRPGVVIGNLLGHGDIMQATLACGPKPS
jgi:SAM-dependent methyltransferase